MKVERKKKQKKTIENLRIFRISTLFRSGVQCSLSSAGACWSRLIRVHDFKHSGMEQRLIYLLRNTRCTQCDEQIPNVVESHRRWRKSWYGQIHAYASHSVGEWFTSRNATQFTPFSLWRWADRIRRRTWAHHLDFIDLFVSLLLLSAALMKCRR